ncbi:hypothetical protein ACMYSP_03935 [Klebsiella sp. R390]|uniref:hypothetical protein n=1 Tax=Klebsiella sp. R390 TaxID=2755400 RepID=UPI003DA9EF65
MAIYPILTPLADVNNISGKTDIDNGYIRNAYEIINFNNDTTSRFHGANITRYQRPATMEDRSARKKQDAPAEIGRSRG